MLAGPVCERNQHDGTPATLGTVGIERVLELTVCGGISVWKLLSHDGPALDDTGSQGWSGLS